MNTFIDRQLAQNKYKEMLQEAAEARAERKVQLAANPNPIVRNFKFAWIAVPLAVVLLIVRMVIA
jgi:hypothetical protein